MAVLNVVRLSHDQIKQIIEEHLSVKYGGSATVEMIWPTHGVYGTEMFANVAVESPEGIPLGYHSSPDDAGPVREFPVST